MILIGHQHISMQSQPKTFRKICQQFLEFPIVTFVRINGPPFDSPGHYVIPGPGVLELEVAAPSPLSGAFSSVNLKAFFLESLDPTLNLPVLSVLLMIPASISSCRVAPVAIGNLLFFVSIPQGRN
jgi:hypothetical protein